MLSTVIGSLLVTLMILCAVQAVRAGHLLTAALWLAGVSASASSLLFVIGAFEIAVIELSLSLGLVTVLLVFAISMIGANTPDNPTHRPRYGLLTAAFTLLLITLLNMAMPTENTAAQADFATALWSWRQFDVLLQIVLIFVGVLSVLYLLTGLGTVQQTHVSASEKAQEEDPIVEEMLS